MENDPLERAKLALIDLYEKVALELSDLRTGDLPHGKSDMEGAVKPSPRCEAFIKDYEKCRLKAFLPTPDDVPTLGWGCTGPDIKLGMTWTQHEADARFTSELAHRSRKIAAAITSPTTQAQFDAMTSLAFNIGTSAFINSTLLRKHNGRDYAGAAMQFRRWNKQAGKILNGLTKRRAAEEAMYRSEA